MRGQNGHAELVDTIREIALGTQPRLEPCDYATLDADGGLKVYGFAHVFQSGEFGYLVHDNFLLDRFTSTNPTHVGDHGSHSHTVIRPPELDPLALWPTGTVVLVVWTRGRSYPVIVGRVVS